MKMAEGTSRDRAAVRLRLLEELNRLEQAQRELDLRDWRAVEALERSLAALRRQIAMLDEGGGD